MTGGETGTSWNPRITIIVIILLFLVPVLLSWYLVFFTDFGRDGGGTQHGLLLKPPQQLEDVMLTNLRTNGKHTLHDKWTLLLPVDDHCGPVCRENLYALRQIHLAMGKDANRVQRVSYYKNRSYIENPDKLFADYPGHLVLFNHHTPPGFARKLEVNDKIYDNAIYLVDPAGFVVICYPEGTDPSGVIKDMKRLLRISKLD